MLVFAEAPAKPDELPRDRIRRRVSERSGFVAAYVPGNDHVIYPEGLAKKLPAGTTLHFQLHYTPNGKATTDRTKLGIVFLKQPLKHEIYTASVANRRIRIPAGAENHEETARLPVPWDVQILALMPHMHLRGKAFRYEAVLPGGQRQLMLDVPRYDFNWQLSYRYEEPLKLPRGSRIEVAAHYDNSASNPANPDPTREVRWGDQSDEEMLLGYLEYIRP